MMRAMVLRSLAPLEERPNPLEFVEVPDQSAAQGEVLVRVSACGVSHTELDEIEGRASPAYLPIIPGHQVVGRIVDLGSGVSNRRLGERVGVGWVHSSTGAENENLVTEFRATGRHADGGYAELMRVPEDYCYPIPDVFSDLEAAPLLCAGADRRCCSRTT